MPTIADVQPHVKDIACAISKIAGVTSVYIHGSLLSQEANPQYALKDIDVIAMTDFDSGDLMAIDAGEDSPLKIAPNELEDLGFNRQAVSFTKQFLAMKQYNLDHWAASIDGKILHWGQTPENIKDWQEVHEVAETYAQKVTGYNRLKLAKKSDQDRCHWRDAYMASINRGTKKRDRLMGWFPSDHPANEILAAARRVM